MLNCMATCRRMDKKPFDNKMRELAKATDTLAFTEGGKAVTKAISNMLESINPISANSALMGSAAELTSAFDAVKAANEVIAPTAAFAELASAGKQLPLRRATCADHRVNSAEVRRTGPR